VKRLELERFIDDGQSTLGRLRVIVGSTSMCEPLYTIERPWDDNRVKVSCIPAGTYELEPRRYNRGNYDAWVVMDVPDRSHILFHAANWSHDVLGCIGIGFGGASSANGLMVTNSRKAFAHFMDAMGGDPRAVLVIEEWGK